MPIFKAIIEDAYLEVMPTPRIILTCYHLDRNLRFKYPLPSNLFKFAKGDNVIQKMSELNETFQKLIGKQINLQELEDGETPSTMEANTNPVDAAKNEYSKNDKIYTGQMVVDDIPIDAEELYKNYEEFLKDYYNLEKKND